VAVGVEDGAKVTGTAEGPNEGAEVVGPALGVTEGMELGARVGVADGT
jgi:hypothetical protein